MQYKLAVYNNIIYVTFNGKIYVGNTPDAMAFLNNKTAPPMTIVGPDELYITNNGVTVDCIELHKYNGPISLTG